MVHVEYASEPGYPRRASHVLEYVGWEQRVIEL